MPKSSKTVPNLRRAIIASWRGLTRGLFDPYRPELHYMRGPGPKWREKHQKQGEVAAQDIRVSPMTQAMI
jgi:hypothetical protein